MVMCTICYQLQYHIKHETLDKALNIDLFTGIYTLKAIAPGNTLCFTRLNQNTLYRSG
jgi:hypothetical protein